MPQTRKKPAPPADEVIDVAARVAEPTPKPAPIGYIPPARWVRTTAKWQDETDDSLPFSAEINVAGLSQGNTAWVFDPNATFGELWRFFADRVRNWNATAYDRESGAWVVARGPETIGMEAFRLIDNQFTTFIVLMLNDAINGGDDRKKSSPS